MSRDFMVCEGSGCSLKNICLRFDAYKKSEEERYCFEPHKVGNDCEAFINIHNDERED